MHTWHQMWCSRVKLLCMMEHPFGTDLSYVAILIRSPSVLALMFKKGVSSTLPGTLLQDSQQRHLLKGMLPLVRTVSCGPVQLSQSALLGNILSLWKDHWWRHTLSLKLGRCFPREGEFQQVNFGQEIQQGLSEL